MALALLSLWAPACDDELALRPAPTSAPSPKDATVAPPVAAPKDGGAASVVELVAQGRAAHQARKHEALVRLIATESRDLWMADLLVVLALDSIESNQLTADKNRRAAMRTLLRSYGATSNDPKLLSSGKDLGQALLTGVSDRNGLLVVLLRFADENGAPYDPHRALTGASEASATGQPLLRLTERLRADLTLQVPQTPPAGDVFALLLDDPKDNAVLVLRVRKDAQGRHFFDES